MTALAEALAQANRQLVELGLNHGSAGNVSVRDSPGLLITPSGMTPAQCRATDMVWMDMQGQCRGDRPPSSEWRFHRDILASRPEIGAVVHTHATFATTLACLRREVPPFHYMIALTGAAAIRCAPYALFGSQALSDAALEALRGSKACLLANHGMIALGRDLDEAVAVAVEVESLCEMYWRALQAGEPALLTEQEMAEVFERFRSYGRWGEAPAG